MRITLLGCLVLCVRLATLPEVHAAEKMDWSKLASGPSPRSAHACVYDGTSNRLIVIGGENAKLQFFDDLWLFDITAGTWKEVKIKGEKPKGRNQHAVALDEAGGKLYLFGGFCDGILGDFWELDLTAFTWTEINTKHAPLARDGHSLHFDAKAKQVLLLGGFFGPKVKPADEVWSFDCNARKWNQKNGGFGPRWMHASCLDSDERKIYLFGGTTPVGVKPAKVFSDLWVYNIEKDTWQRDEAGIQSVCGHGLAFDPVEKNLYAFAGYTGIKGFNFSGECETLQVFSLKTKSWKLVKEAGNTPSARGYTTLVCDPKGRKVYALLGNKGGFGGADVDNAVWSLPLPN